MFHYRVEGMTCSACSAHVQKAVDALPFVAEAQVSLLSGRMTVRTTDGTPHSAEISAAVNAASYRAIAEGVAAQPSAQPDLAQALRQRFWLSLLLLVPLMWVSMQHMFGWPLPLWLDGHRNPIGNALGQLVLSTPVLLLNRSYFTRGFRALRHLQPSMDSLIAVGSGVSYLYGLTTLFRMTVADMTTLHELAGQLYFESAAMILTLITLGKFLEARAKRKTTSAIEQLVRLAPDETTVVREGVELRVPTAEVRVGDILRIRPGERIPVDGVLLEGVIALDQSHLTGESVPAEKSAGDALASGSLNSSYSFQMRVTQIGEDTTLAKIVRLVQEAGDSKAPIARLADRISGVFVPIVMGLALLTLILWLVFGQSFAFALARAVAVLVISCPCALGLATPVAIMVGTGVGAQHGILFRNGEVLETLHHVDWAVLDKTGTLTEGRMSVQEVAPSEGTTRDELLQLAVTLEHASEHPVAQAVVQYASGVKPGQTQDFLAVPGRGVSALVEGEVCLAGNAAWMAEHSIAVPPESGALTLLYFTRAERLIGRIGVSDTLKASSAKAVDELKRLGVKPCLLTGDRRNAALSMAQAVGIDEVLSEVLPADKVAKVRDLQQAGHRVAMIGDGVNDAPALKQADVGLAVGSGTEIALETADVVLASGRLTEVSTAIRLSRSVIRNIKENLFWAFFYNVIGIPVAAGALYPAFGITLNPMIAAAAMSLSSVCVVTNALRLRRFRAPRSEDEPTTTHHKEESPMTVEKTLHVEGMSCNHCRMSVQKALASVPGVTLADVDLERKTAKVQMSGNVSEDALRQAVTDAGFEVSGVE